MARERIKTRTTFGGAVDSEGKKGKLFMKRIVLVAVAGLLAIANVGVATPRKVTALAVGRHVTFVHSTLVLPPHWSAGPIRGRSSVVFPPGFKSLMIRGPGRLRIQLEYVAGPPGASSLNWLPAIPVQPFSGWQVAPTRSRYVLVLWQSIRGIHFGWGPKTVLGPRPRGSGWNVLYAGVTTLHGAYSWTTSPVRRLGRAVLMRIFRSWRYPKPLTVTQAVPAILRYGSQGSPNSPNPIAAWDGSTGFVLTYGDAPPGSGAWWWYLFGTNDAGKSWHLTHVTRPSDVSQGTGFPDANPTNKLVAMVLTGRKTLWIAQTYRCRAGPLFDRTRIILTQSTNGGRSWNRVANAIHVSTKVCATAIQLQTSPGSMEPTVRLSEDHGHAQVWIPSQWKSSPRS